MQVELTNNTAAFVATASATRFKTRDFASYAPGKCKPLKSTFNPAAKPDGQALAGSGALVWEGELLELPRR